MQQRDFAHLHCHSHFSLLDGNCKIDTMLDAVQGHGQDAIALTDHGNLFGALSFYKAAKKRDVRPIIGCEAYVTDGSRKEKKKSLKPGKRKSYHITLLAENNKGFDNLVRLASTAYVDGFYYKPRIDHEVMREHSEGLICLSGCLASEVNQAILSGNGDEAERLALTYQDIFGKDNFFLELMDHGMTEQHQSTQALVDMAGRVGAKLVATNDVHYVRQEDWIAQDISICIGTGKLEHDTKRLKMSTQELYLKSTEQMVERFRSWPEAIASTREIADRCDVELTFGNRFLPSFKTPNGEETITFFKKLCHEGLKRRYREITPEIENRLAYEMDVITSMGFVDYFLITWDFIKYAKERNIPVGPGRGSAAGSLISYALDITDIDPLRYDLLFERFLNSERVSMPDIDIDFCKDRRGEVIQYVEQKYGRDHVAQIITFGTMKSRAVIRDVGRVLDMPHLQDDRPDRQEDPQRPEGHAAGRARSRIQDAPEASTRRTTAQQEPVRRGAEARGQRTRHASIHAAGVVIADAPAHRPRSRFTGRARTSPPSGRVNEILEEDGSPQDGLPGAAHPHDHQGSPGQRGADHRRRASDPNGVPAGRREAPSSS